MKRIGVLGSTRGSHLAAIHQAGKVEIVISNKADALILQRAKEFGLHALFVDPKNLTREEYDAKVSKLLKAANVDLVVLIGYMRILSANFVNEWPNKIINVHPSLLPAFAGKMDLDVHRAVLASGAKETGCTVHYVTAEVDAGPVVVQKRCPVLEGDTPETLKARVQQLESEALITSISTIKS